MTDTTTLIARHEQQVERIRNNPDLSEQAKRRMIAETHEEAMKEHAQQGRRSPRGARGGRQERGGEGLRHSPTPSVPRQARRR